MKMPTAKSISALLRASSRDTRLGILAYCLMSNHVHLVGVPEEPGSLAVALRRIHGRDAYMREMARLHSYVGYIDDMNFSRVQTRRFHAHTTERLDALNGIALATFWQRVLGFVIDFFLVLLVWGPLEFAWRHYLLHQTQIDMHWDFHEIGNIAVALVYWGLTNYLGNGQTPGKWVVRFRAMSLTSERMGPWQSFERALGYGAAVLEGGLGFAQFFWDHNRMCAQDRLAETIVVDVRKR
jgi:REP element-mobilizing transposase RayT